MLVGARVAQWVRSLDLTTHTSLSAIRRGFAPGFVNFKKGCTWLAAASDKIYQLLAHGRWFSPGTPASSTTKTGRHDIAEILLKVALKHKKNQIKSSGRPGNCKSCPCVKTALLAYQGPCDCPYSSLFPLRFLCFHWSTDLPKLQIIGGLFLLARSCFRYKTVTVSSITLSR
jgi:hypothetical protein